jgi:DNA topoisomerase-1
VATGRDFDDDGKLKKAAVISTETGAHALAEALRGPTSPSPVEAKPYTRARPRRSRTTTLQQEASRKLRLHRAAHDARRPGLYENGYITYMRTDSVTLSGAPSGPRDAGPRALRRRVRAGSPRVYTRQGEERPGGPRGHPPAGDTSAPPQTQESCAGTTSRSTT